MLTASNYLDAGGGAPIGSLAVLHSGMGAVYAEGGQAWARLDGQNLLRSAYPSTDTYNIGTVETTSQALGSIAYGAGNSSNRVRVFRTGAGTILLRVNDISANSAKFYRSTDNGATFSLVKTVTTGSFVHMFAELAGAIYAIGRIDGGTGGDSILKSTDDGQTWTALSVTAGASITDPRRIVTLGSHLIYAGTSLSTAIAYSTNGTAWTTVNLAANVIDLVVGGGKAVALLADGRVQTSADGVTWAAATQAIASMTGSLTTAYSAYHTGSIFAFAVFEGAPASKRRVIFSSDAATWSEVSGLPGFSACLLFGTASELHAIVDGTVYKWLNGTPTPTIGTVASSVVYTSEWATDCVRIGSDALAFGLGAATGTIYGHRHNSAETGYRRLPTKVVGGDQYYMRVA